MISNEELLGMQSTMDDTFETPINIINYTSSPDSAGGQTRTASTVSTFGRVGPFIYGGGESISGADRKLESKTAYTLSVSVDEIIYQDSRVTWPGGTLEIISSDHDRTYPLNIRYLCREVK